MNQDDYFFCGIGGSGMLPLAMIVQAQGNRIEGSDRSRDQGRTPEKFAWLVAHGMTLHPQDGSGVTRAGQTEGRAFDEDQLAFLRDERDYRNPTLVELPRGDFAFTVQRNLMVATLLKLLWQKLETSSDAELAAIAGKAVKEARYHQQHAADWVVRLGDGTDESARRSQAALAQLWRYVPELFEADAVDEAAAATGLGPRWADVQADWQAEVGAVLAEAGLTPPAVSSFRSTGKRGVHTEHMGVILAERQQLQRAYPGGVW